MVSDIDDRNLFGLLEIKCPASKRDWSPSKLYEAKSYCIGKGKNDAPFLKNGHMYYTQVQMAMGLSQAKFCDFVVYTFKGMLIIRVPFHQNRMVVMRVQR